MTTLTGSVLLALAHAAGGLTAEEAWAAAYVDERHDYVTSEPAIDYAAASILLLAALDGRC